MFKMTFLLVTSISIFLTLPCLSASDSFSVNKMIGDLSFKEKFGSFPLQTSSEILRIQTHLEYVELLIRRQTQTEYNSSKKLDSLAHLNFYWKQGVFPQRNSTFDIKDNRRPRFIDHRNVHCAVGYLILKSPGFEQLPKEIHLHHEYSYIDEIKNENLERWMNVYNFTLEELKMIQPTYDHEWFRMASYRRTFRFVSSKQRRKLILFCLIVVVALVSVGIIILCS